MTVTQDATATATTADEWAALLATAPVGADTAGLLPGLDARRLSPAGRIDALRALERHVEWIQALQVRILAALDADPVPFIPGSPDELADLATTQDEVALALRLSAGSAAARLDEARRLVTLFPRTLALLADGRIHYMQARAVCEVTANCDDDAARRVEELVAPLMPGQNVAATRKALHRAVLKADPAGAEQRHAHARQDRRVCRSQMQDGMAWWSAFVPAEDAARMDAAVDAHAEAIRSEGDTRTLDQRRADALVDLVMTGVRSDETSVATGRTAPLVQVTVPFDTLIGTSDEPAELKGYGPITAAQARALASQPGSIWRRLLIKPTTGMLLKTDPTTYRPTAEVTRHVVARDAHCQFPACCMPAHRCDIDHVRPFNHQHPGAAGPTEPDNLIALCRRHHRIKHEPGWHVERDPTTGRVTWTTPTGHRYVNEPHAYPAPHDRLTRRAA